MREPILHHYDMSPYAEKIRLIFGRKGLRWHSVQIPVVMPKPDLTELTGGYRRTPTLQLGADIYCDTKIIVPTLERLFPDPPLVPVGQETLAFALSRFGEGAFMVGVLILLGLGGFPKEFLDDRKSMAPPGSDFAQVPKLLASKLLQMRAHLDRLERHLAGGDRFMLGAEPGIADFSCYHPLLFLQHPRTKPLLEAVPHVRAWMGRVAAVGHGERVELPAEDAIAMAREARPAPPPEDGVVLPEDMKVGDPVAVLPEELGSGVVTGTLWPSGLDEIAVLRRAERAGELVVHLPRQDYVVVRAGS